MAENIAKKNIMTAFIEGFKRIIDFKGRSSKFDFWGFVLCNSIVTTIMNLFVNFFLVKAEGGKMSILFIFSLLIIYALASVVAWISICVRRLHDIGKSGKILWIIPALIILCILVSVLVFTVSYATAQKVVFVRIVMLLAFLFLLGSIIYLFVMMLRRGSQEENAYGAAIVEDENYNRLANLFAILYIVLAIANRYYAFYQTIGEWQELSQNEEIEQDVQRVPMHNSVE